MKYKDISFGFVTLLYSFSVFCSIVSAVGSMLSRIMLVALSTLFKLSDGGDLLNMKQCVDKKFNWSKTNDALSLSPIMRLVTFSPSYSN